MGARYGDLRIADGSLKWRRGRKAAGIIVAGRDDGVLVGRGWAQRGWALRLESLCGGREDIAFLLRRAAGGERKRRREAGRAASVMMCRS